MEYKSYCKLAKFYDRMREESTNEEEVFAKLSGMVKDTPYKLVVLDDDPTGVQAVHDIYVFTDYSVAAISEGLLGKEKMFFLLTNSRALTEEQTEKMHREIAINLMQASKETKTPFLLISRGDSTLRGHYPLETKVLRDTLCDNGCAPFDGEILVPFFQAGGRVTISNVHYVKYGDDLVPAGETEFAKDKTFGYQSSDLCDYIEEKTNGLFRAEDVTAITLESLRRREVALITKQLLSVNAFGKVVVNALDHEDLAVFCISLYEAIKQGKHFLFRTAADFVKIMGAIEDKPLLKGIGRKDKTSGNGGIVVVGSHTEKTTKQLEQLKTSKGLMFIEFDSDLVLKGSLEEEIKRVVCETQSHLEKGKSVVIYTKRTLLTVPGETKEEALLRSVQISEGVLRLVLHLQVKPSFVVAKGGITSSDIGVKALGVKKALVLGQAQPGIPVWQTDRESKFPGIPYVIFPGNVGEEDSLKKVVEEL